MTVDQGHILHDRLTRGEELTFTEQQTLHEWYQEQDQAERMQLGYNRVTTDTAILRIQLESAMKQLALVSKQIEHTMLANDVLRRDITQLQAQLVPQLAG